MKQKVVIRVSMGNKKKGRSKALKIAATHPGVESAGLEGPDKDQIQVIGEGIDAVRITSLLIKKVGPSEIVSLGPVEQKKEEGSKKEEEVIFMGHPYYMIQPQFDYCRYNNEPSCSIM